MMKINPVYILMLIGLLVLVPFTRQLQLRPTSFYGIAENQDLDLSLEYPVLVKQILVKEGESVKTGQVIAIFERTNIPFFRANLEQERLRLQADKAERLTKRRARERELAQGKTNALFEIDNKIAQLEAEQAQNERLAAGLSSVTTTAPATETTPEMTALKAERKEVLKPYDVQINNLGQEVQAELAALDVRIKQTELELAELDRQEAELELKAPIDGVIGKVNFIAGEKIDSRETILNIYRLHPDQVVTYIPEGQLTDLAQGDSLVVRSVQEQEYVILGIIIGLGNKIRELPVRMRRDPAVQAWGREVLLQIPADNELMQGERVLVEQITD